MLWVSLMISRACQDSPPMYGARNWKERLAGNEMGIIILEQTGTMLIGIQRESQKKN